VGVLLRHGTATEGVSLQVCFPGSLAGIRQKSSFSPAPTIAFVACGEFLHAHRHRLRPAAAGAGIRSGPAQSPPFTAPPPSPNPGRGRSAPALEAPFRLPPPCAALSPRTIASPSWLMNGYPISPACWRRSSSTSPPRESSPRQSPSSVPTSSPALDLDRRVCPTSLMGVQVEVHDPKDRPAAQLPGHDRGRPAHLPQPHRDRRRPASRSVRPALRPPGSVTAGPRGAIFPPLLAEEATRDETPFACPHPDAPDRDPWPLRQEAIAGLLASWASRSTSR